MQEIPYNVLSTEAYIIYLRKSRSDNPNESVEEVLAKHEKMLQDLAVRELGGLIPEHCIFREIVSGETIEERPQMQAVLSAIENPAVKMVLVVEPSRLSRGDLVDCGNVVNAFRYSNTKIMTTQMTYDLQNKMHRKFFEQELMRGNDYLEYTKEILHRGRFQSAQRGNFMGSNPPFGYDNTIIDGGPSLKPNENADAARMIFDMYVNQDKSYKYIARHLDKIGVKPKKGVFWDPSTIRTILENIHYTGMVKFGEYKQERVYEKGKLVKKMVRRTDPDEMVFTKGKHQPLISQELFDRAQEKMNRNPRRPRGKELKNVLAGLFYCQKCGMAMKLQTHHHARGRLMCGHGCGIKSVIMDDAVDAVLAALELEHLPDLETKLKNNDGSAATIQQESLKIMQAKLDELRKQEEKQYELLEKGLYSEDVFVKRNKTLHDEMESLKTQIYETAKTMPKEIDYEEKIILLKDAIAGVRNPDISVDDKNSLLKKIIDRIEYEYISYEGRGKINYALHIELLI